MSTEEHGAYLLLLMAMWRRNGTVPNDDKDLARIVGLAPRKWLQIKARLLPFLNDDNGVLSQKRLQKEWEFVQQKRNKNAENGALGGRPKSINNNDIAKANGSVSDNPNESPHTHTQPHKEEGANAPISSEPEKSAPSAVAFLPTVSDGDFPFFETDVEEWVKAFPAVDVRQQLAAMRSWLIANPTKRKTKRGMRKFVVSWLDRKQNAGTAPTPHAASPPNGKRQNAVEAMEEIFRDKGWTQENEPEFVPSHNRDAQRLPSERRNEQGAIVDLRPGTDWRARSGH